MDVDRWRELEYTTLRQEILTLFEAHHSTPRFFLPAAAGVYTIPYVLQQTSQVFLWSMCAGVVGLMLLAMNHTLFASVDGVRRVGTYIKEAIEPDTKGGLRWEGFVFAWHQRQSSWQPSEHAILALGAVLANIVAATGAGYLFIGGGYFAAPAVCAILTGALSVPTIYSLWRSPLLRRRHTEEAASIIQVIGQRASRD